MKPQPIRALIWAIVIAAVASTALLAAGELGVPDVTPRAELPQHPGHAPHAPLRLA